MSIPGDMLQIYADMLSKEVEYETLGKTEYMVNKIYFVTRNLIE